MEFVHSSSARRVADPASELLACTSEFRCVSTFGGEDKSNEQSSAGNKDDAVPDVRILPSKPNQPKLNFLGGVLASSGGDSQFIGMKNIPGYITLTTRTLFFAFIVQLL